MPTYDYRCRDCGHTIEIIHSILEDGPELCERCRGPMQRVLHPSGVIFRGSGFYVTDSRSSKAQVTGESGGGEGKGGEGKGGESKGGESKGGEGKGGSSKGGEGNGGSAKGGSSDGSGGTSTPAADSGSGGKD